MKGEQLDLLAWVRPTATVIHFPCDREASVVRETARQIERRSADKAAKFWRTECNRLYGRLQLRGWDAARINAEIERFAHAVQREIDSGPAPESSKGECA